MYVTLRYFSETGDSPIITTGTNDTAGCIISIHSQRTNPSLIWAGEVMATAHKLIRDNVVVFALVAPEICRSRLLVAVYFTFITLPLCNLLAVPSFCAIKKTFKLRLLRPIHYRDLLLKMIFSIVHRACSDDVRW